MERSHMVVGVCAVALAGAATGASINTTPIHDAIGGLTIASQHPAPAPGPDAYARDAAPVDQYALVTPQGRFEVGELRDRGLYSQQRFGGYWRDAVYHEPSYAVSPPDYRYVDEDSDPPSAPAQAASDPGGDGLDEADALPPPRVAAVNAKPLAPPVEQPVAIPVKPRMIDVSAVLASR
ncbi:MAG: hypothetical protein ACTHK5_03890 [Tsuneonella sp.]